jgi:hypothetical protein
MPLSSLYYFDVYGSTLVLKASLHYGDYHSKLVHFEEETNIFCIVIHP